MFSRANQLLNVTYMKLHILRLLTLTREYDGIFNLKVVRCEFFWPGETVSPVVLEGL